MEPVTITSHSPEETQRIGAELGRACTGGEVFLLIGTLGAGKTCFTQGLAWGLGVDEYTHSPTFVLVTEYRGRTTLYHVDLYRIDSVDEAMELGLDEYLTSGGVCAIEWADKALEALSLAGMVVELDYVGPEERRITLRPLDRRHDGLAMTLKAGIKNGTSSPTPRRTE